MCPLGSRIFAKAIVADINVFSYIGVDFAIQTSVFIVIFVVLKLRVCEIDFAYSTSVFECATTGVFALVRV